MQFYKKMTGTAHLEPCLLLLGVLLAAVHAGAVGGVPVPRPDVEP